jgi:hypothetical protein
MLKPSARAFTVLITFTALLLISWQAFAVKLARSTPTNIPVLTQTTLIATAAAPPQLTTAVLGGKSVYVLYITQTADQVLVRCYPGYAPTITLRAMGRDPKANAQKEGVMTCRPAA